ncbi:MAG: PQQ-binding-like beta-propeller repeat protein, partial [Candidatus Hydrothermarchaeaceae archaeon]
VDMSSDGDYMAAGTFTSTTAGFGYGTYLFDKSGELLWKHKAEDVVWSISITEDGSYIASGSKDKHVYFFDKFGKLLWKYKTDDTVWSVSISANGEYVAAGSYDNNVYLFDKSGERLWNYKTDDIVLTTSISANGEYVAAGSYDNNVYLFDKSGKRLWKYKTDDVVLTTSISANGEYVAAGSYDNNVYLFDRSGNLLFKYRTNNVVLTTSISSSGEYVAAGSYDNNVYLFDRSGNLLFKYKTEDEVWDVAISSDGSYISAASKDFNVYFLSTSGELVGKYRTGEYVSSVAISKNGDYIIAGSYDRNIYFFRTISQSPVDLRAPKLDISKTVTKSSLGTGENSTVLIELKNAGQSTARNVEFADVVPEGLILVSGELSHTVDLGPGESKTFSYTIEAIEIKEKREVMLPALNVSYTDIKGNPYTAKNMVKSSAVFITLLPKKAPANKVSIRERLGQAVLPILKLLPNQVKTPNAGIGEKLGALVSSIPSSTILKLISFIALLVLFLLIFSVIATMFSLAVSRVASSGKKHRRKIDRGEILMKIRKEVGEDHPESLRKTSKNPGQVSRRDNTPKARNASTKLRFSRPLFSKKSLLKRQKRGASK